MPWTMAASAARLELSSLLRRVRARVLQSTDGQQRPHEYGSLLREHYLSGVAGPSPVAVAAADGAAARLQQETVFWQSIMNSRTAADFEAYLSQFPAGAYRALATNRLAALRGVADRFRRQESDRARRNPARCSATARRVQSWS